VVTTIDSCPLSAGDLPPMPNRDTSVDEAGADRCAAMFGDGAVCYGPGEAWRLASLLQEMGNLWWDAKACEAAGEEVEMREDGP
jgi:hypothetical protein